MKISKKIFVMPAVALVSVIVFLIILDVIVFPLYVSANEYTVPKVIGMKKDDAIKALEDLNLSPIITTSRFDEKIGKDRVMFQKPLPNAKVKEGRRVYLTISGGEQMVAVPNLINKTLRDVQITLSRNGLVLGKIDSVQSEFPVDIVCGQQFLEGRDIAKGSSIGISISIGPEEGKVRVPGIISQTLSEAEKTLKNNSLRIGTKTYIVSATMLPNTVVDQQPSEGSLVAVNDSVNVILTQSK
jgi:eukaryotic-like serine/threonine-protein kinase